MSAIALVLTVAGCSAGAPPQPSANEPGLARGLESADSLVQSAVGRLTAGAVLVVSRDGHVVHQRAFGLARIKSQDCVIDRCAIPTGLPMHLSTMFDLASVTKVMATTFALMILVDQGKVDLDAPVYTYLSDFKGPHLDSITVRNLLQHSAGLVQWQPLYYQASNTAQTCVAIRDMPLQWGVGEGRHYSDFSFMLLGDIVEHVSGERLDAFVDQNLYKPLGLHNTTFNPKARGFKDFAATEEGNVYEHHMVYDSTFAYKYRGDPRSWNGWRNYTLVGEVDDGNSFYANGGVAGHAGLFSTGADLNVLMTLLLNKGTYDGRLYIHPATVDRFFTLDKYANYLGWQYPPALPAGSFSHTGFTGTYVLGVPGDSLSVVLLTNRQQMGTDAKGFFPGLGSLQAAVSKAIVDGAEADRMRPR
jgi:CubicO group peptidase (beta-lactamase class C family)